MYYFAGGANDFSDDNKLGQRGSGHVYKRIYSADERLCMHVVN